MDASFVASSIATFLDVVRKSKVWKICLVCHSYENMITWLCHFFFTKWHVSFRQESKKTQKLRLNRTHKLRINQAKQLGLLKIFDSTAL